MNILTFDIEEWFHILDNDSTKNEADWAKYPGRIHQNMELIFELLAQNNQKATFFCLGWVARKHPDIIRAIVNKGYEVATHSDLHQLAYEQSREAFKADLETSIKALEDVSGKKVKAYRAPGFSIKQENKWAFEVLVENGIEIDCSVFPAKRAHGGFAEFGVAEPCWIDIDGHRLKEFPINTFNSFGTPLIFSGGGYFRLFPSLVLEKLMKQSDYVMTYFHPRDFDAGQPMIEELSRVRKFKSYYGLKGALGKLEGLLQDFKFIDLQAAENQIDWQNARIVKL
ncbi:polysaccharide deacetylase family protein, PEP-CTERM locus subfamily [Pseudarcicella hirudinis]|uniref:Polysaccharide deacetylase family protein, PEP-CTERM locus subfamily n=1 Tax=Pseudarcicella hirudinis TaxID=1079859 RepID=A0A1I5QLF1_9BACT|nr:polysaccharide deacetylase family protein [Pseudarcicella hirudinis]SFP47128.1 polysaccharide deacetylase family protein, PEP-CTERM locus subfamily [Pseudarcicella hirudinis]